MRDSDSRRPPRSSLLAADVAAHRRQTRHSGVAALLETVTAAAAAGADGLRELEIGRISVAAEHGGDASALLRQLMSLEALSLWRMFDTVAAMREVVPALGAVSRWHRGSSSRPRRAYPSMSAAAEALCMVPAVYTTNCTLQCAPKRNVCLAHTCSCTTFRRRTYCHIGDLAWPYTRVDMYNSQPRVLSTVSAADFWCLPLARSLSAKFIHLWSGRLGQGLPGPAEC